MLDLLIVAVLISSLYRSRGSGFVRQFFSSLGFFGGLALGRLLEPYTVRLVHTTNSRASVLVITILGMALVLLTVGEYAGLYLKKRLLRFKINHIDNVLGVVLTVVSFLLCIWLLAAASHNIPSNSLQTAVKDSRIIGGLNRLLPQAPKVIADIGNFIDPNGFPDVFIGDEPIPRTDIDLPALGNLADAVTADRDSVVRVEGQGCGGVVSGSGFVVGKDMIATNAHVVAGIKQPYVQDVSGSRKAQVVSFDPQLDFAVLRVPNLAGKVLEFDTDTAKQGTPAAVLGYPGGGDFKADPAAVLSQLKASGHDIYGGGHTVRAIYELRATIIPGNSGGPLVGKDGRVLGVIFAQSTNYKQVGYALTTDKVLSEVQRAQDQTNTVSTGRCTDQ